MIIPRHCESINLIIPRILFAVFFLCITSPAFSDSNSYGGTYVSASIGEPSNLIPILATDASSQSIVGKVFNGLLKYNPSIELEGDLAESWEILDEGKTIIFHLRKGVVWHDLRPFTARDVEFTYQRLIDPEMPSPYKGDFEKVHRLEVLDDHTVRITYAEAFSPGLSSWTMWMMPKHLLENEDFLTTDFIRNPIGTGPYKFKRWKSGEKVELVAFKHYFEGRPKIDRVVERVIPDQTTMFLELHQESVDSIGLTPLQFTHQTHTDFFKNTFTKYRYPSFGYTYMGFNLTSELFNDVRVREAIDLAIDKKEIIDGVLLGLGRVCTGPFTPESWAYNPDVDPLPHDIPRAKVLLKEAGWMDQDGDGVLDKDGKPFEFTIVTNQGNYQRQQAAEIIQRRLKHIGMKVHIKVIEWSTFIKKYIDGKNFDAILLGWGLSRDPDPFDIWHSSKMGPGEFNFIHYRNEVVDKLIEDGRKTFDQEERRRIYHLIHRLLYDDHPYIFLYIPESLPIVHNRFKNVEATPIGLGYNFIHWEVPREERRYTRFKL